MIFYQLNHYQARNDFITPLPNHSIENIQKIDILFASNNMHRVCVCDSAWYFTRCQCVKALRILSTPWICIFLLWVAFPKCALHQASELLLIEMELINRNLNTVFLIKNLTVKYNQLTELIIE